MIDERVMALGQWDLTFRADTPRYVLDLVTPFSEVGVFIGRPSPDMGDTSLLSVASYMGVVTRPGPQLSIGGHSLAMWLGTPDRTYMGTSPQLPESVITGTKTLNQWVDAILAGTGLTRGSTDGTAVTLLDQKYLLSPREALDPLCVAYGLEWRINNSGTVDVDDYVALYGAATAVLTRTAGGRDINYAGVQAQIESAVDFAQYASKVRVVGGGNTGTSGGASTFRNHAGQLVTVLQVVDGGDVPFGSESVAAAQVLAGWSSALGIRTVDVSTDMYDVSTDIGCGDQVYVYDPEVGLVDLTNPIPFRGQTIRPLTMRAIGIKWPVRDGMGVMLRTHNGTTATWTDLTPYIAAEDGSASIELAANRQVYNR